MAGHSSHPRCRQAEGFPPVRGRRMLFSSCPADGNRLRPASPPRCLLPPWRIQIYRKARSLGLELPGQGDPAFLFAPGLPAFLPALALRPRGEMRAASPPTKRHTTFHRTRQPGDRIALKVGERWSIAFPRGHQLVFLNFRFAQAPQGLTRVSLNASGCFCLRSVPASQGRRSTFTSGRAAQLRGPPHVIQTQYHRLVYRLISG